MDVDHLFMPGPDGRYEPSKLTRGPWRPDAQHGGPPSALLATLVEEAVPDGFVVARISVELVRPVPLSTLIGSVELSPVSRRVTHASASLSDGDGHVVALANALLLATDDGPAPDWAPDERSTVPGPDATVLAPAWLSGDDVTVFHRDGLEQRPVDGGFAALGPADMWVRIKPAVVAGRPTTPLAQVLGSTDIGSGISSVYDPSSGWGMINADLTLAVTRPARGDWVRLQSISRMSGVGTGLAVTQISDPDGHVAVATQSLLGYRF